MIGDRIVPYPLQFNLWACTPTFSGHVERELASLNSCGESAPSSSLPGQLLATWGKTLTEGFFQPYLEKMWRRPLNDIPADWGSRFVPPRNMQLVNQGRKNSPADQGYNATFVYPACGRVGEFTESLALDIRHSIRFASEVSSVDAVNKVVTLTNGEALEYSSLISTIPLNMLLEFLGRDSTSKYFAYSNLLNVRVGCSGKLYRKEHWLYLPDRSTSAFRVGFPANVSDRVCPEGSFSLSLEVGLGENTQPAIPVDTIAHRSVDYLSLLGVLSCDKVEVIDSYLIRPAYVAHRMAVTPHLQKTSVALEAQDIHLAGRYGAWDYMSLEDAYISGAAAAGEMLQKTGQIREVSGAT